MTGTLDAPLAAGEAVEVVLPNGQVAQGVATSDGLGFSFTANLLLAEIFGVGGTVSAYVLNAQQVKGPVTTQSYVADSQRSLALITATPGDVRASGLGQLALSGDGRSIAFDAFPTGGEDSSTPAPPVQAGVYLENLQTQAITLVAANGSQASVSQDGQQVAYVVSDGVGVQVHVKSFVTGLDLLISATARSEGTVGADGISDRPSLSADGQTVTFESSATDLVINGSSHSQIFVAQSLSDVAAVSLVSAPEGGTVAGDGDSLSPSLSADATTVAFASTSDNLLDAASPYTGKFAGTYQIYVRALATNAVTGQHAGQVTLVTGLADGTVADGESLYPSISGNGRYVVFQSSADNLVPGVIVPAETDEIYVKDLLTGAISLVSASGSGQVADQGAASATISADGRTVVFESTATNLLPAGSTGPNASASGQLYAKDLVTGTVTLLSAAGYTPGNADSGGTSTLSADGSEAAFSSDASNLVAATDTAAAGSFHGYVTGAPTTPLLTIQAPGASTTAARAVFTGTVDAADAGQAIIVNDTTDPGFSLVTATVTATSDPTVDRWTATVGLRIPGSQMVTATINGVSGAIAAAAATITYAGIQQVTIDPVGAAGALNAAALQPGGTTVVTGTAMGVAGQMLRLSLQQAGGPLLALGTAVVSAADGTWSVTVANATLDANPSGNYALVADVTNAQGQALRGARAVSLTVPAPTTLYDIMFTYSDGSSYFGTVADQGSLGYRPGETILSVGGQYSILSAAGVTTQAVGTVTTSVYYDVSTAATYTATATGGNGLGSETGVLNGIRFGGGSEARLAPTTLYDFYFRYNDGSYYYGTVAADGAVFSYHTGQSIVTPYGSYYVYGSAGATTQVTGTVHVNSYFDVLTGRFFVPVGFASGNASGSQGLSSELDQTNGPLNLQPFGKGGQYEAEQASGYVYKFYFKYLDGSYYYGTVAGGTLYPYHTGESLATQYGYYYIYAQNGTTTVPSGTVTTSTYFDVSAGTFFVPNSAGTTTGTSGLGSELDHTMGAQGISAFGMDGKLEAYQAPSAVYNFYFRYTDGSYYYGTVDSGTNYRYYTGYTINTAYGYYYIYSKGDVTTEAQGTVHVTTYFDQSTGNFFTPTQPTSVGAAGTAGLGSELDHTSGDQGVLPFGLGGQYEAKQAPNIAYKFYFKYLDGSYYYGTVAGVTGGFYAVGQNLTSSYGYYYIYAQATTKDAPGTIRVSNYYDVTSSQFYVPVQYAAGRADGTSGLGSESDQTTGAQGLQAFGLAGSLEARQAPTTLLSFYFRYEDGSYYFGKVAAGLGYIYRVGQSITGSGGYYYIYASSGVTSQLPGTVTASQYYDVSTGNFYTPVNGGAGKVSGSKGLTSEVDYTTGPQGLLAFGYGGSYEARQGPSQLFTFRFTYADGSFYTGTVAAGGRFDLYTQGETLNTAAGVYGIGANLGNTPQAAGTTHVDKYYDSTTGATYVTTSFLAGVADGTNGLLYELDSVTGPNGLRNFGQGGAVEAKEGVFSPFKLGLNVAALAFDGPISGATIGYFDPAAPPGVVRIDATQPTATTDPAGHYALDAGNGPLVLTGGTDEATGLAFHGILEAPANASVLSPITTLITEVARQGGTLDDNGIVAAQILVASALGLSPSIDLDNYAAASILQNPQSDATDTATAESVFKAGARLQDVETLIDAAGGSSRAGLINLAVGIANKTITDITDFKALIAASGLMPDAATVVEGVTSANIVTVDAQLAGVTLPGLIFDIITGSSIAQQGDTVRSLAAANGNTTSFVDTYVQTLDSTLAADDLAALSPAVIATITITGTHRTSITDEQTAAPFSGVTIPDLGNQSGDIEAVTITETGTGANDAHGSLSGIGLLETTLGSGVYTLNGTLAQVTSELAALSFTPKIHEIAPGQAVTTGFTLAVTQSVNGTSSTVSDSASTVTVTAVNDAPTITGTHTTSIADVQTAAPFSGVTILDVDNQSGVTETVTITETGTGVKDANGSLSGFGLVETAPGSGVYTLSGTLAQVTSELDALSFKPTAQEVAAGQVVTTGYALNVTQSANGTTSTASDLSSVGNGASQAQTAITVLNTMTTSATQPGMPTGTGTQPGLSTASAPIYRFFDNLYGTHLFTQSLTEAQSILANRPDLTEETNNFGAVDPQSDTSAEAVYRFFETSNGTHFFTASRLEYLGLVTPGSGTYRSDLTYEASSTFYEDSIQQSGEVAVYRLFDTAHGTQFLTGSQSEYAGLTTAGSSTYRSDLNPEGIAFYAPTGSFAT